MATAVGKPLRVWVPRLLWQLQLPLWAMLILSLFFDFFFLSPIGLPPWRVNTTSLLPIDLCAHAHVHVHTCAYIYQPLSQHYFVVTGTKASTRTHVRMPCCTPKGATYISHVMRMRVCAYAQAYIRGMRIPHLCEMRKYIFRTMRNMHNTYYILREYSRNLNMRSMLCALRHTLSRPKGRFISIIGKVPFSTFQVICANWVPCSI